MLSRKMEVRIIPPHKQRYPTVGDYWTKKDWTQFRISRMEPDYELLVLVHELIEQYLVSKRGIKEADIDKFDKEFELRRLKGNYDEPGNDPSAPYYNEHQSATFIEQMLAKEIGVDWDEYDDYVNKL